MTKDEMETVKPGSDGETKTAASATRYEDASFYDRVLVHVKRVEEKDQSALRAAADAWLRPSHENRVYYDWTWLGIPIIQTPSDMMVMQELIFRVRPNVVIETGVAHGGSAIFYSSVLQLLHGDDYSVIGVEKDFRSHNRTTLDRHPLFRRVTVIEGDSTSDETVQRVADLCSDPAQRVMVALDSYHGKEHVLEELRRYSDFVSVGSYIVVFDTVVDILDGIKLTDPTVGRSNSPKDAVDDFLERDGRFVVDESCNKLFISHAHNGFLKRVGT